MSVSKLCLICFGEASDTGEIPIETRAENGAMKNAGVSRVATFADSVCKYLPLRHPKDGEETSEENIGYVCGVCKPLLEEFCEMHQKLLELKKGMNGKLKEISEKMKKAERDGERKEEFEAYQKCAQLQQKRRTGKYVNLLGFRNEFLEKVKILNPEADSVEHNETHHSHTRFSSVPADPKVGCSNAAGTSKSPSLPDVSTDAVTETSHASKENDHAECEEPLSKHSELVLHRFFDSLLKKRKD